jgi:lysophospholipase L1-like esterase
VKKWILSASLLLNVALLASIALFIIKLGGVNYLIFKMTAGDDENGLVAGRASHFKYLDSRMTPGKIVFIGDSITAMAEWSELLNNPNVVNRGIGGDSTKKILVRIEQIARQKPAKIFIMAGVNDLVTSTIPVAFERYSSIVRLIRQESPDTLIYVQSALPVNNDVRTTKRNNQDISALNDMLMGIEKTEKNVKWVDVRPVLTDSAGNLAEENTFDGIHLNGPAYEKWKSVVEPLVAPI